MKSLAKASRFVFRLISCPNCQVGFSISPERLGLLGTVVIDTQGQHLPMERVEKGPFIAYEKPEGIAYISNLAVAPQARRQGVGEKLLRAAEKVRNPCIGPQCEPHMLCSTPPCISHGPALTLHGGLHIAKAHRSTLVTDSTQDGFLSKHRTTERLHVQVAMDWGSKGICLHCDPLNEAASALYRKHGYRKVATQTGFLPWLQFGPTVRLNLMKKTVR